MPISERPERMTITDLGDQLTIEVMFNPSDLSRRINVNYAKKAVLGNSHMPHEYLQTDNQQLRFDLFYNAETPEELVKADAAAKFLESLAYATRNPDSIAGGAPPRVLLLWPRTMSIIARLTSVEFRHQRWNRFGNTTQFTASCSFEESSFARITKQFVRDNGARRVLGTQSILRATTTFDGTNGGQ